MCSHEEHGILLDRLAAGDATGAVAYMEEHLQRLEDGLDLAAARRSEEHTSELQSLMRISYAVFCLTQKLPPVPNQQVHSHTTRYTTTLQNPMPHIITHSPITPDSSTTSLWSQVVKN